MCDGIGEEERAIDAELTKVEAVHPELTTHTHLGDRKAITWMPDAQGWTGDAFDWRITATDAGEYLLHHRGETASFATLDWAMAFTEVYRIMEGPPGVA